MADARRIGERMVRGGWGLILSACVMAGCGWWGNHQEPKWIGLHRDDVVQRLGAPVEQFSIPGGGHRLVFIQLLARRPSGAQVAGATLSCRLVVETDERGIVTKAERTNC